MANPDYYQTLGVAKSATADEIRKSYRKLARENHPDVKKDDPAAAQRFREIQEAYAVLGDVEKRQQFDRFGTVFPKGAQPGGPGGGGGSGGVPFDVNDLFGGGSGEGGFSFEDLFGGGGKRRGGARRGPRKGNDIQAAVRVPFLTAAVGGSVDLHLDRDGTRETLGVKIPPGVPEGGVIRLAGQGEPSFNGGPSGDLLLTVQIEPHPYFKRDGNDLLVDVPLTPAEAVLGAKVDVPTLSEGTVVLSIPPGTSSGAKLRLRGKGLTDRQTKQTGDQFVIVKIVVPKTPSDAVRALYQQLAADDARPREGLW
jgi:curved DNA-binding protein